MNTGDLTLALSLDASLPDYPIGRETDWEWLHKRLYDAFAVLVNLHNGPEDRWAKHRGAMSGLSVNIQPSFQKRTAHVTVELGVSFERCELDDEDRTDAEMHAEQSLEALVVNLKHDLSPIRLVMHGPVMVERETGRMRVGL